MMFLLRFGFWVALIILVFPAEDSASRAANASSGGTSRDLTSFCSRHPRLCMSPGEALHLFQRKASYAYSVGQDLAVVIASKTLPSQTAVKAWQSTRADEQLSNDTLNAGDREPEWTSSSEHAAK